jgi:hypothetical protein
MRLRWVFISATHLKRCQKLPSRSDTRRRASPGNWVESSRGRDCPRRPLTPPYVRFRIRRFIEHTGSVAGCPATKPTLIHQRSVSDKPRSYDSHRRSAMDRVRCLPTSMLAFHPSLAPVVACYVWPVASIAAIAGNAVCAESTRPTPAIHQSMFETIPINQLLTPPSKNSDQDFEPNQLVLL